MARDPKDYDAGLISSERGGDDMYALGERVIGRIICKGIKERE